MVSGKFASTWNDIKEVYRIWQEVFHNSEQMELVETSALNADMVYVLVYEGKDNTNVIATGRLTLNEDVAMIDGIAVLNEFQGQYYGDFALRMLLNRALLKECKEITLESPASTIGFFEKVGFTVVSNQIKQQDASCISMIYPYNEIKKRCNSTYLR